MKREELDKLNKNQLIDKVLEVLSTDAGKAATELEEQKKQNVILKGDNEKQKATIEGLTKDKEALEKLNEQAMEKLADAEKNGGKIRTTVKHGEQKYQVMMPKITVEGETYTAEDLKANPKVVAKLVEMGSGVLKKI